MLVQKLIAVCCIFMSFILNKKPVEHLCILHSHFWLSTSTFFVTVRASTAYRKIWRLVNNFFARIIRFTVQKFQLFWVIFCSIIFCWIMAHFNFVISQNAKWGHAGFTLIATGWRYRKIFFYKKSTAKHCGQSSHTRLTALCPRLPGWAGTRKVKPVWILLKQETVIGSGISWAICKSAPRSRQITTPAPHHSVFYRPDALPATQPTASKHCGQSSTDIKSISKCVCDLPG